MKSRLARIAKIRCQACGGDTFPGLDLGPQPLGDPPLPRAALHKSETYFPLQLVHCGHCGLTQLSQKSKAAFAFDEVARNLKPTEVFELTLPSWLDIFRHRRYERIAHRTPRYGALRPLQALLEPHNLEIFDLRPGETLHLSIGLQGARRIHARVAVERTREDDAKLYDQPTLLAWAKSIEQRRRALQLRLWDAARAGKKIVGIGAAAPASTVCNYCRLGPELIDYIAGSHPPHLGAYLPGVRIPITDAAKLATDPRPADLALLFDGDRRGWSGEVVLP